MKYTLAIVVLASLTLALAGRYAQAAEPTMLTLSCDGKITHAEAGEPETAPINNVGLVVNFADRTVSFSGLVAKIESIDESNLSFRGDTLVGDIDRVTGAVGESIITPVTAYRYDLLCKVTNRRLF